MKTRNVMPGSGPGNTAMQKAPAVANAGALYTLFRRKTYCLNYIRS